jgi:hypothetical protein
MILSSFYFYLNKFISASLYLHRYIFRKVIMALFHQKYVRHDFNREIKNQEILKFFIVMIDNFQIELSKTYISSIILMIRYALTLIIFDNC